MFGNLTSGFNVLKEIGKGLESIAKDPKYEDWLFVFGTIVAQDYKPVMRSFKPNPHQKEFRFYNFAPMYKGGTGQGSLKGSAFIAPKTYVSGIDFLTGNRHPGEGTPTEYYNQDFKALEPWLSSKGYTMVYDNWFMIDNILMTVEICLDHAMQAARESYYNSLNKPGNVSVPVGGDGKLSLLPYIPDLAQISLVSSAGMSVQQKALIFRKGGSIFLQDGLSTYDSVGETCKVHLLPGNKTEYQDCRDYKHEKITGDAAEVRQTTGLFPVLLVDFEEGLRGINYPHIAFFDPVMIPS